MTVKLAAFFICLGKFHPVVGNPWQIGWK